MAKGYGVKIPTKEEYDIFLEEKGQWLKEFYIESMKLNNTEEDFFKKLLEIDLLLNFIRENNLEHCFSTIRCIKIQIHHHVYLDAIEQERLKRL